MKLHQYDVVLLSEKFQSEFMKIKNTKNDRARALFEAKFTGI